MEIKKNLKIKSKIDMTSHGKAKVIIDLYLVLVESCYIYI